ncbi:MAG: hypothetical protein COB67_11680 [SAR324 cluster bacterium]|uniref:Zinc ribbon domain-containing protein n=1 Tax=SAR324 cluster bacterium TaxID=2024889 RepID=A0A2A4SSJ3_9DELT|nr:MAG: hypothetical protein COB67_11680 [SAR324 cluster bacterium]
MVNFKCPVCHARFRGEEICKRCQTDLTPLIQVIDQSILLYNDALQFSETKQWQEALTSINQAITCYQSIKDYHRLRSLISKQL